MYSGTYKIKTKKVLNA